MKGRKCDHRDYVHCIYRLWPMKKQEQESTNPGCYFNLNGGCRCHFKVLKELNK